MITSSSKVVFALAVLSVAFSPQLASATKTLPPLKREMVEAIFAEVQLPPLKGHNDELEPRKLSRSFSFGDADLKEYANSGPTFGDIEKDPSKFEKEFPLRAAVVASVLYARKVSDELAKMPDTVAAPITDNLKRSITETHQRTLAAAQGELAELDEKLDEAGAKRDLEKSKRWLAQYDYIRAQIKLRLAWCYEYNLTMGRVKRQMMPDLDVKAGNNGWRLVTSEKIWSPKEIRNLADKARDIMARIAAEHPRTPWALLADKQREMALGLQWEAANLE